MQAFKQTLIQSCRRNLTEKIHSLDAMVRELTESANADTKSTAGDKHETSRAMVQLEQEKLGTQLKEAEIQLMEFDKTDFSIEPPAIAKGSVIETNKGIFFIAGSIGKLTVESQTVFVISHSSPLANALLGKKEKDTVVFNTVSYKIFSVN